MTAVTISKAEIEALDPCYERWDLLKDKLPEQITADVAVEVGATLEDLLWVLTESGAHDTLLNLFAADCAAHVLHIYEETESSDAPRKAIVARRALARGEITREQWQVARDAAPDAEWATELDAEEEWQLQRLVARLNNPGIPDWPLPEVRHNSND